ncbi:rhomboid family protein [Aphelenchoides avenae]|nr:rhomboid family protein [Aphelenchus avenae]
MSVAPKPDVVEHHSKDPDGETRVAKPVGQKFWYDLFEEYDTAHDGRIPLDRFYKLVREGADRLGLSAEEVAELLREADANNDSYIDFAEFVDMMNRLKGMYGRRLSLYTARAMLPKPQQTQPAREILEHEWWPPPVFILTFIAMEAFFFVYQQKECGPWTTGPPPCAIDRAFILLFSNPFQIWRWITNIFVHHEQAVLRTRARHLFGNIVGQILFGATLELAHRWRIVVVFLLGALSSALFAAAVRPMTVLRLAGASGGVYALIGAHIANVALNWDEMRHPYRHAILVAAFVGWDAFGALREATGPLPSTKRV